MSICSLYANAFSDSTEKALIERMQRIFHHSNFYLSMVYVTQSSIESFRLTHGWYDGQEITHYSSLAGAPVDYLAKNKTVTFRDNDTPPYSIQGAEFPGLYFSLLNQTVEHLLENYEPVAVGVNRIAGQLTQVVRLSAKSEDKFNFMLWLDKETALPLRVDIVDKRGNIVEQFMAVDYRLLPEKASELQQLAQLKVPDAIAKTDLYHSETKEMRWQLGWLPDGFSYISRDQHQLFNSKNDVDYFLLSDGVVDISVYISDPDSAVRDREQYANRGATNIFRMSRKDGRMVTLVGEVPINTLKKIAQGIYRLQEGTAQ